MTLLTVVLVLIAVGVLVYLSQLIPWIDGTFKSLIKWVAIFGVIIWIAGLFGLWNYLGNVHIGR